MISVTQEQIRAVTMISWLKRRRELLFLIPHPSSEERKPPTRFSVKLSGDDEEYILLIVKLMEYLVDEEFIKDEYYSTGSSIHFLKKGSHTDDVATWFALTH